MSTPTYFQLTIRHVPIELEDEATQVCMSQGAQGVSQNLIFSQPDLVYDPQVIPTEELDLVAYFDSKPTDELMQSLKSLSDLISLDLSERPHEDWMEGWKKNFKPFQLVGPFWIVPSWLEAPAGAEIPLRIDPGMAFGTGTHATTRIASHILFGLKDSLPQVDNALDVGTGTGVLALILSHLGAKNVDATEIDEMARETARENLELNDRKEICVHDRQIEDLESGRYGLVVANIIDGVLVRLKEDLLRILAPQGVLIVTGILDERKDDFLLRFLADTNLDIAQSVHDEEWWGFVLRPKIS